MAFGDVETDIGFVTADGVDDALVRFKEFSLVTALLDRVYEGKDGGLGVEVVPLIFTHAIKDRRVFF